MHETVDSHKINGLDNTLSTELKSLKRNLEELSEGNVIETIGTVEHDTLFGDGFRQVLGGLRLTRAGRTFWSTTWKSSLDYMEFC